MKENKYKIIVIGGFGQLGKAIQVVSKNFNHSIKFFSRNELDITNFKNTDAIISNYSPHFIINCAAYTNVNLSEYNNDKANLVNNLAVGNLCEICKRLDVGIIHISTDYVFDGLLGKQYKETDKTNPINYYGLSKLNGEKLFLNFSLNKSIIIRTSWIYSLSSDNFVNKIYKKLLINQPFDVVDSQISSPTNAYDLAYFILKIIPDLLGLKNEIFNYTNLGFCSRYEFSKFIKKIINSKTKIIKKEKLISEVKRPKFSSLDFTKTQNTFNVKNFHWSNRLKNFLVSNNYEL